MMTLADLNKAIEKLAERADRLSHHLHHIRSDDDQVRAYLYRVGTTLRDTHTVIIAALATMSPAF
jgi:hypothetical protein